MSTISPLNAEQPPLVNETLAARGERRVAINSGLLLVAFSFQAFVSLIIVGITARYLGQSGLGRYAYAISLIELFVVIVDMGMNRILVREISKQREETDRLTSSIWTLRLLLTVVVMVIVGIVAGGRDMEVWWAVMVYFVAQVVFLLGDVFGSVFQGYQRMEYQFWGINLAQVLLIAFTLGAVWLNFGLIGLFAARLLANAARLAYVWWISVHKGFAKAHFQTSVLAGAWLAIRTAPVTLTSWRQDGKQHAKETLTSLGERLGPRWQDATLAWHMFVESLPVGISLLLRSYIWRAGVVLTVVWLGQQQGDLVNGVLYGPLRAVQQLRIIPAAFAAAMLPVFSNRAGVRQEEFDSAFAKSIKLFAAISLLIALSFTFLADPMVHLLLGDTIDLQTAALVLAMLGWVIVLYFPNWLYGVTLVALGRQKLETIGLILGVIGGYIVASWGIPRYQAMGVTYAILAAEAIFFVVGTAAMWKHFRWRTLAPSLAKIVLACGLTGLIFLAGNRLWHATGATGVLPRGTAGALLEILLVGGVGLVAFVLSLWLLRAFDPDEQAGIKAMLRLGRRKA